MLMLLFTTGNVDEFVRKMTISRRCWECSGNFSLISTRSVPLRILEESQSYIHPIARTFSPIYRFKRHDKGKQDVDAVSKFSVTFFYLRFMIVYRQYFQPKIR